MKYVLSLLLFVSLIAQAQTNLRVNYLEKPLGIDDPNPRFSWCLTQDKTPLLIIVKDSKGQVVFKHNAAAGTVLVNYDGEPLQPFTTYTVQVGEAQTTFETGMMGESHWQGAWVCDSRDRELRSAPYFRKTFSLSKLVEIM